jgi:hypothetical protein
MREIQRAPTKRRVTGCPLVRNPFGATIHRTGNLHIEDTYNGATITDPQTDINSDIHLFLNGSPDAIELDTTQVATDTIDYVVTDPLSLSSAAFTTIIAESNFRYTQGSETTGAPARRRLLD